MCARLLLRCTFCLVAVGYPGPAIVTAWSAPDGPAPRADAGRVGCIGRRERKRLTALLHSLSASPAPPKHLRLQVSFPCRAPRRLPEQQRRTWGQHLSRKPQWPGWPLRGQRLGEAANPGPPSAARGPASDGVTAPCRRMLWWWTGSAQLDACIALCLAAPARTPHGPKGGPANKP